MKIDSKTINDVLNNLNFENIKCFNELYYFQDEVETLKESGNKASIIEKFLHSYLCKVNFLCELDKKDANIFIKWYETKGKNNLIPLLEKVECDKINVNKLIRIFMRFDILLEQAVHEENIDSLLNLLIDIPMDIHEKLQEWGCFDLEVNKYNYDFIEQYKSQVLETYNLNNLIPAAMQVSLLYKEILRGVKNDRNKRFSIASNSIRRSRISIM